MALIRFDQYRPHLLRMARRAVRRYGGEAAEFTAEAYLIYAQAVRDYEPRLGPFDHLLNVRLKRLATGPRREARRRRLLRRTPGVIMDGLPGVMGNSPLPLLGPDALAVARLAIASRAMEPRVARGCVRRYFLQIWPRERYDAAVREIREVLE